MTKPIDYTRHRYCYGEPFWECYDYQSETDKEAMRREVRAGHYGNLTYIDERVGDILTALEDRLDNTMVIYTSDHGCSIFDNGLLHKGTHFDESLRVPFVVRWPGEVTPGVRRGHTSHVDFLPTLIGALGEEPPGQIEGIDFSSMFSNPNLSVQDFTIMECTLATSIVTDRYRMSIHHINKEGDLYDNAEDPHSFDNLYNVEGYRGKKEELTQKMVRWRRLLPGQSRIPDSPEEWEDILGPGIYIDHFRSRYEEEYDSLRKLDPDVRPGRVGHHIENLFKNSRRT